MKKNDKFTKIENALKERIKELECLYSISRIFNEAQEDKIEFTFIKIISVLPDGYQFPENTHAKIVFNNKEYKLMAFKNGLYKQFANIVINNQKRGIIEIIYSGNRLKNNGSPFLKEEQHLLDTISRELSIFIDKIEQKEEKKKIAEQLMHSDRLATLGSLAAGIAHELNEPIGSILGFAQLTVRNKKLPTDAREDIYKIINSSLHAREIIRKLLYFSKQEKQKKILVNINKLVRNGYYFIESLCTKEAIEIEKKLDPAIPELLIDPVHLNQIIVNLMVNAIQAMPKGGKLLIRTKYEKGTIFIIFEDTGIGMREEVMNRIFEPFFTTKEEMNTGLGLAVVNSLIKLYNGSIIVKSKVGQGSVFTVKLPVNNHS